LSAATSSTLGVVKVDGNTILSNAGTIYVPNATSTTKGAVTVDNSTIIVTSGMLSTGTDVAKLSTTNVWTKAQTTALYTLTDASTISLDLSQSNIFIVTLAGNRTLGTPTYPVVGGQYTIVLKQDGTGNRTINWPAYFKFRSGQSTTLSTVGGKYDVLTMNYVASNVYLCDLVKGF